MYILEFSFVFTTFINICLFRFRSCYLGFHYFWCVWSFYWLLLMCRTLPLFILNFILMADLYISDILSNLFSCFFVDAYSFIFLGFTYCDTCSCALPNSLCYLMHQYGCIGQTGGSEDCNTMKAWQSRWQQVSPGSRAARLIVKLKSWINQKAEKVNVYAHNFSLGIC